MKKWRKKMSIVKPIGKNVLVLKVQPEEKKGLILVNAPEERFIKAEVICSGELTELVTFGHTVLIDIYQTTKLGDEFDGMMLIKEEDILAIVEE